VARIQIKERRSEYGKTLWETYPELQTAYSGVQILIHDYGEAFNLPRVKSSKGQIALRNLAGQLENLIPIVLSLPNNPPGEFKGKETRLQIEEGSHNVMVRLVRYAKADSVSPVKWLWTGSCPGIEPTIDRGFTDLLQKKLSHYSSISTPFWLVLYSLDCHCDNVEQAALLSQLVEKHHPFNRVYLFSPGYGNEVIRLHPISPKEIPSKPEARKKTLFMLLPEDAVPNWDDPRWRSP